MDISEQQERLAFLEAENTALHQSAGHAEKVLAQLRAGFGELENKLSALNGECSRLRDELARKETENRELDRRAGELETRLAPLTRKLAQTEEENSKHLAELNRLRLENASLLVARAEDPERVPPPEELTVTELNMLGYCHSKGLGGPRDLEAAFRYFMRAAALNDPVAQYNVGFAFYDGRGCKASPERAFRWFKLAAGNGSVDARYYLGECYETGRGVDADPAEALRNYEIAAETGDLPSMERAAVLRYYGAAGHPDPEAAVRWLRRIARLDRKTARKLTERFRQDRIKAQASSMIDMELQELLENLQE